MYKYNYFCLYVFYTCLITEINIFMYMYLYEWYKFI